MVLKNRTTTGPGNTFLQRRNGQAALAREKLVTHYLRLVSSDGYWLDRLNPPQRSVAGESDSSSSSCARLFRSDLAEQALLVLTNQLESLALQFNLCAPPHLFITVTAPAYVVENASLSTSYFRARLSSGSQSLVMRAAEDLLEIFLMPVGYTLGLSREEAKQNPTKQLRVSGDTPALQFTCIDSGETVSSDSIGSLCKELFSTLISESHPAQKPPLVVVTAGDIQVRQPESNPIDELLTSPAEEIVPVQTPRLCQPEPTEPESFLNKLYAIATARPQPHFPFDLQFFAKEKPFHIEKSELSHHGSLHILPIRQSSSTPVELSFVPTDRVIWTDANQLIDIAVMPCQLEMFLQTEFNKIFGDKTIDRKAIRRLASLPGLRPFDFEQLRTNIPARENQNIFEQANCLEKLAVFLRRAELLIDESCPLEQILFRYLAIETDSQAIEIDITKHARRGEVCFSS